MSDLQFLADWCEAAPGPDEELDARIFIALEHPDYVFPAEVLNRVPDSYREAASRFQHDGMGGSYPYPAYTDSVDDALKLVPEDFDWLLGRTNGGLTVHAEVGGRGGEFLRFGNTAALALCAAALRARVTEKK